MVSFVAVYSTTVVPSSPFDTTFASTSYVPPGSRTRSRRPCPSDRRGCPCAGHPAARSSRPASSCCPIRRATSEVTCPSPTRRASHPAHSSGRSRRRSPPPRRIRSAGAVNVACGRAPDGSAVQSPRGELGLDRGCIRWTTRTHGPRRSPPSSSPRRPPPPADRTRQCGPANDDAPPAEASGASPRVRPGSEVPVLVLGLLRLADDIRRP